MSAHPSGDEGAGRASAAPRLVIDEHGREVGVLLEHAEYIALLAHLAAGAARSGETMACACDRSPGRAPGLTSYWRRALAAWVPGGAVGR